MSTKANMGQGPREALAKQGKAMAGGRYPITNKDDLSNAIRAIGRTDPSKRPAVKAFIKKRAAALGLTSMIPADW
jgi:hypothetical protein